ncbi:MAG: hypothetical protein IKE55_07500 [Kiritimatiellae bacterium]|nr:hypothetical protein [Kiritimatiellia bacterium]
MTVRCPHCGAEYDVEKKKMYRYMKCGACGKGFVAGAATDLQQDGVSNAPPDESGGNVVEEHGSGIPRKPKIGLRRPAADSAKILDESILMEEKLRLTINPRPPQPPHPVPYGSISAAEERVRMYEEMRRKEARQKMARNFVDSLILLLCLGVVVGCCLWWRSHTNRVEKERIRLQAEAEANRIKQRTERDRVERERREKDRLEREAESLREAERKKKEQAELARRQQEECEAQERADKEVRSNKERYHLYMMALKENNFDMFVKSVTNDMDRVGGELCYLLPSATTQMPLFHVTYETNGVKRVFKLYEDGRKDEVEFEAFQDMIKDSEYLVAKGGTVHFRSTRKNPATGLLPMVNESDPAEAFFGSLSPILKILKPTYDELTFDVFFAPHGSGKTIFVENLPFGCAWSRRNVREAIENNTPMNSGKSYGVGSRAKKFKRTVKIWNGTVIKQGADGITYVPSSPPPERYRTTFTSTLPNVIYRSRTSVRYDNSLGRWQTLHHRALQEDAEEAAYYERLRQKSADCCAAAQAAEEQRWQKKVDGILSNGVLSYKIRKAKVKD